MCGGGAAPSDISSVLNSWRMVVYGHSALESDSVPADVSKGAPEIDLEKEVTDGDATMEMENEGMMNGGEDEMMQHEGAESAASWNHSVSVFAMLLSIGLFAMQ